MSNYAVDYLKQDLSDIAMEQDSIRLQLDRLRQEQAELEASDAILKTARSDVEKALRELGAEPSIDGEAA